MAVRSDVSFWAVLEDAFRFRWWKLLVLALTFLIFFFVNIPAMAEPCNWRACPDYIGSDIVSLGHVNFYEPAGTVCGIGCFYRDARWHPEMLAFDIVVWLVANCLIVYFVVKNTKNVC